MPKGGKQPGAGRPKGALAGHTILAQEMRKALIEAAAEEWGPSLIYSAKHGEVYAIRELFDRIFGKASQGIELTGKDGGPIPILANLVNVPTDNSNTENKPAQ
jgi:hypothetical protein